MIRLPYQLVHDSILNPDVPNIEPLLVFNMQRGLFERVRNITEHYIIIWILKLYLIPKNAGKKYLITSLHTLQ